MEANVRVFTTTLTIISGDQLENADSLTVGGKKLLICKGGDAKALVKRVFTEFSQRLDRAGNKFQVSKAWRGLSHTDPYGASARITGLELEAYLTEWFVLCECVRSPAPRMLNSPPIKPNEYYLKILDRLPAFVGALISQSRFLDRSLVELFEVIA